MSRFDPIGNNGMSLQLSDYDESLLSGEAGAAAASAMKILVAFSDAIGAEALIDVSGAHIDGCSYHELPPTSARQISFVVER